MRFRATVSRGLEAALREELQALGVANPPGAPVAPAAPGTLAVTEERGAVAFEGPPLLGLKACLWSRIASRILAPLAEFDCRGERDLYDRAREVEWESHFTPRETLAVEFVGQADWVRNTLYPALKVKDAIADRFRSRGGARPSVDRENADIRVHLHLRGARATLSLDLSGESLHERGYRATGAPAPLKENLAAGLLALAGWDSIRARGGSLLDPFCGGGTFPIEAALIAGDVAPGLQRRHWGFSKWRALANGAWVGLLKEAEERARAGRASAKFPVIVGTDEDPRAVHAAIANAGRAGARVHFERKNFADSDPPRTYAAEAPLGIVVMNPPYGERLGEAGALEPLYRSIGDTLKRRFAGWEGWVLTGNPALAGAVGLKPARKLPVFNGPIECRFLRFPVRAVPTELDRPSNLS